jgi:hypothetical protein
MRNNEHRECFGTMFPDDLHLKNNQENKGKVFTVCIELVSGFGRGDRSIGADIEQWDDCQQCAEFDSCYKLCLAKATLESIVASQ